MDRKTAILRSANEHFASHGFRGASLRDIARDAQVSLTLLNHHFGSKLDLLRAVIEAHRWVIDDPVAADREMVHPGAPPPSMEALIGAWLDVIQRAAGDRDGRYFLRLLARMVDDPQAEASALVRDSIEDYAQVVMDAVCTAYPGTTRRQAALAYLCVTTTMLKCVTAGERLVQLEALGMPVEAALAGAAPAEGIEGTDGGSPAALPGPADDTSSETAAAAAAPPPERALLLRFLLGGLEALVAA
jgi:AcrR family transcriptional regulator